MRRRSFLQISATALAALATNRRGASAQSAESFDVTEKSITQLQAAMASGQVTSEQLVSRYIARIKAYDQAGPRLNAVIAINPRAATDARELDRERRERGPRGPRSRRSRSSSRASVAARGLIAITAFSRGPAWS